MGTLNSFQKFAVLIQNHWQLYFVCIYVVICVLLQLTMVSIPLGLWSVYALIVFSLLSMTPQRTAIILGQYTSHGGWPVSLRIGMLQKYLAYLQLGLWGTFTDGWEGCMYERFRGRLLTMHGIWLDSAQDKMTLIIKKQKWQESKVYCQRIVYTFEGEMKAAAKVCASLHIQTCSTFCACLCVCIFLSIYCRVYLLFLHIYVKNE